jgi:hypothetical protein
MSDYLSNLVARTLESAPVLQPRQPSLFEPVGGGWGMVHRDWGMEMAGETAVFPAPPPPATPLRPQPIVANQTPLVQPASSPAKAAASPSEPAAPARPNPTPPARPPRPAEKPETIRHTTVIEKTLVQQRIEPKMAAPPPIQPAAASDKPAQPARRTSRSETAVPDPAAAVKAVTAPPPSATADQACGPDRRTGHNHPAHQNHAGCCGETAVDREAR